MRTRIALGTLCAFNAFTLLALGVMAFLYVDGTAGKVAAVLFWGGMAMLSRTATWLRRGTEWG